ncbi:alpha/beta fold hydrolase [Candidatus Amarolinea aalborgensis]|uniref:alpha/beta fold hydrolase n=1 Tax=Candidatus Amarolinea aalborgensis TaxID=2249329 RepID=UPI003BF972EA
MNTSFLDQQGGRIAYDDAGSGPLVVCVPSMGDVRGEYRFLAPQLAAAGYRVVTMDLRGLGESSVAWPDFSVAGVGSDLVALIRSLQAGPAVIVGCSMAAGAAVWAAAEAPELAAGLLLIGPFVRGRTSQLGKLLYSALFARPWGAAVWLRYYSTLYPTRKPADFAAYAAALRANLAAPGRLEALQQMLFASKDAAEERLPRVKAPALVLMGSKDPDFKQPEAEAQWVANSLHARYAMAPGAGHYPHAEMPDITGPLALSFVQSVHEPANVSHAA